MITARATPNIALIKYWGNRNSKLRLPAADSLSITLDQPYVDVSVEPADQLRVTSYNPDDSEHVLSATSAERFSDTLKLMQRFLDGVSIPTVEIIVRSHIPPSVGLASSAAVFSALAKAVAALINDQAMITTEQESVLARLGSGSAARSIAGGFVALQAGMNDEIGSAVAHQVADETHWKLHDVIIIPSQDAKKVGSTEGHAVAQTSPYFSDRIAAITKRRQHECIAAIQSRDFEKLQAVSEEDALDMHHVMATSTPPLQYLSAETHRIVADIKKLRQEQHLPVMFTMDAGPTVHAICTEDALPVISEYASQQTNCTVYQAGVGSGATILAES